MSNQIAIFYKIPSLLITPGKRHRTYEIKVMADIERYANNRKELAG
jgi:hypothetical protein